MSRARGGGVLLGVGAVGLCVSLFLTWAATGLPSTSVVFGAVHRLPSRSGWEAFPVGSGLLAVLAVLLCLAAIRPWRRMLVVVMPLVLLGLAFAIHARASPPTTARVAGLPKGGFVFVFGAASGAGEVLAIVSLGAALAGLAINLIALRRSGKRPGSPVAAGSL